MIKELNIPGTDQVKMEHDKVRRRVMSLMDAISEYDETVKEFIRISTAREQSIPLNQKVQAKLVGLSRSQFYRSGLAGGRNYFELFKKVKSLRPELLGDLEKNFEDLNKV